MQQKRLNLIYLISFSSRWQILDFVKLLIKLAQILTPEKKQIDLVSSLMQKLAPRQPEEQQIILKDAGRIKFLTPDEISWVGGAGNYVELHLNENERTILHRQTLSSMETTTTAIWICSHSSFGQ